MIPQIGDEDQWLHFTAPLESLSMTARTRTPSRAERLQLFFEIESPEKKKAILHSGCGATTYTLIRNLVSQRKPSSLSFTKLVDVVRAHYNPRPSVIMEQFNFNTSSCPKDQSVHLRKLTEHYASLDDILRDRLVCGINEPRLQCRLLT